jgi:hydrogenase expression/formation protein HypE
MSQHETVPAQPATVYTPAPGAAIAGGLACPAPIAEHDRVTLGHGSGGKLSAAIVRERFMPHFHNRALVALGDAAVVSVGQSTIAVSTDSFVVSPLEFPGGNIGTLAVHGTVNDLAMMGAQPTHLTAGFILEEGLDFALLDRVVASMGAAAREAGIPLITADTKVVERGKGDGLFINTTGIGLVDEDFRPCPTAAEEGDVIIVSGPVGVHGMTIMSLREGLGFESELASDSANLYPLVQLLRCATDGEVHVLRDATRGGIASTLNEIAQASHVGIEIDQPAVPVPTAVRAACEMLGLDPFYVANEGVFVAWVPERRAPAALAALQLHPLGAHARVVGRVVRDHPSMVVLRTSLGSTRILDMLAGDQLPRIC